MLLFQEPSVSGHFEGFSIAPLPKPPSLLKKILAITKFPAKIIKHHLSSFAFFSLIIGFVSSQDYWDNLKASHFSWHKCSLRNSFIVLLHLITFSMRIPMGIAELSASSRFHGSMAEKRVVHVADHSMCFNTCWSALGK